MISKNLHSDIDQHYDYMPEGVPLYDESSNNDNIDVINCIVPVLLATLQI